MKKNYDNLYYDNCLGLMIINCCQAVYDLAKHHRGHDIGGSDREANLYSARKLLCSRAYEEYLFEWGISQGWLRREYLRLIERDYFGCYKVSRKELENYLESAKIKVIRSTLPSEIDENEENTQEINLQKNRMYSKV